MKNLIVSLTAAFLFTTMTPVANEDEKDVENRDYYIVEFIIENETVSTIEVPKDTVIDSKDIPEIPEKEGYEIMGWQILSELRMLSFFDIKTDVVNQDLTLNAFYEIKEDSEELKIENFEKKEDKKEPKTGVQGNNMGLYIGLVAGAVVVGVIAFVVNKKNKK